MSSELLFKAPWTTLLTSISIASSATLAVVMLIGLLTGPPDNKLVWYLFMVGIPLIIFLTTAAFSVRGYLLKGQALYIQRLGWSTKIDLTELVSAEFDPEAMERSIRLFGNGGMFSFTGKFRNRKLGNYDAYATALRRSVVLKLPSRTIVVTPDRPEEFVKQVLDQLDRQ